MSKSLPGIMTPDKYLQTDEQTLMEIAPHCPVTTPEGVGDCFYPITTHDPSANWFSSHCGTRDEKKVPQLIEAMALAGVPLAGILRVTEHGQRIDFRSDTVPVMGLCSRPSTKRSLAHGKENC